MPTSGRLSSMPGRMFHEKNLIPAFATIFASGTEITLLLCQDCTCHLFGYMYVPQGRFVTLGPSSYIGTAGRAT